MKVALTGATGFLGGQVLAQLLLAGHTVRALTRRPQPERRGVSWIAGSLDDDDGLARLCAGAAIVVHVAGVVKAYDREAFVRGNVTGTQRLVQAASAADVCGFVHVSSLAAREPRLSAYGASKAQSEDVVRAAGLPHAIVRPPAIYGPGDVDHLELFRFAKLGVMPLPARGRMSVIHVTDMARLVAALVGQQLAGQLYEADDGRANGWGHEEFAQAIARAVGRRAVTLPLPAVAIKAAARFDRLMRGDQARLTPDRAAYFAHPDWVIEPARRPPAALWHPIVGTGQGLGSTAAWYRERGLL